MVVAHVTATLEPRVLITAPCIPGVAVGSAGIPTVVGSALMMKIELVMIDDA